MIHVVTAENRHLYERQLDDAFRLRHDIYVGERKWEALRRSDDREIDQFDTDDTIYHLAIEDGQVVGGSRFCPTTRPHLLSELFAHMATVRGLPTSPTIYEHTRLFIRKDRREESRKRGGLADQMRAGITEYCVDEGISSITLLIELFRMTHMYSIGWKVRPLGLPERVENEFWIAAEVPMDYETLVNVRQNCHIEGRVLVHEGLHGRRIHAA